MKIEIKLLNHDARIPEYASEGSAGMDLCACIQSPVRLYGGDCRMIPTGVAVHIHNPEVAGFILPRSGLGHNRGIVLGNLTGVIDSDYQGEIFVSVWNRSESNTEPYTILPFQRIAQLVFMPVVRVCFDQVEYFSGETERGESGFGSTGV